MYSFGRISLPIVFGLLVGLVAEGARAQEPAPPENGQPILRLEAGGPTSFVTALAFSPDGRRLYAGGWDKVVWLWSLDEQTGRFELDDRAAYRVPIGPGLNGAINTIAVSSDETWLAVAGKGVVREGAGFHSPGMILPSAAMSDPMRLEEGTIYVFDRNRQARVLRGHRGPVVAMAFAPAREGKPPLLVSAAEEWSAKDGQMRGAVRVWDVSRGEQIGGMLLDRPEVRPGLQVLHTGQQREQIRVALAWGDGQLRLWDLERRGVWTAEDTRFGSQIAYWPAQRRLLTAGVDQLRTWNVDRPAPPRETGRIRFAQNQRVSAWGLTLFASRPGEPLNHAAVVGVRQTGDSQVEYALRVVGLQTGRAAPPLALWTADAGLRQPAVAASPGGQHVAVAGGPGHEILVYRIDQLLGPPRAEPQRLRGVGASKRNAAFARKGDRWGLLLSTQPPSRPGDPPLQPRRGDRIFDLTQGAILDDQQGWSAASSDPGDWTAELDTQQPARQTILLRRQNQLVQQIVLPERMQVTSYALLPAHPTLEVPILAVALHQLGQPQLILYNGQTGEPLRHLTGHTERIRAVAFAEDGRLLVTAGDDQTVSVWSLVDLDEVLGGRGQLAGLAVEQKQGELVVQSPASDRLQPGDVIQGLVTEGELREMTSALELSRTLWQQVPGDEVTLRVARPGQPPRDVIVPVEQGVDERKPLVSLFLSRDPSSKQLGWIGWNPLGPFDRSDRNQERYLGWHFNAWQQDAPALFSRARQYHEDYFRPGLLGELVREARLGPPPDAPPKPAPVMSLWLEADDVPQVPDARGDVLVQTPDLRLQLRAFPLQQRDVFEVVWARSGEPADLPMVWQAAEQQWTADLSTLDWKRGRQTLRVLLRTREAESQQFSQQLQVRYQPAPPVVAAELPQDQQVDEPDFRVVAQVQPAEAGVEQVNVSLIHRHGGQEQKRLLGPARRIDERLQLEPGDNEIELLAQNADAPAGDEGFETTRQVWRVSYNPRPVPSPVIALSDLIPLEDGQPARPATAIARGETMTVSVPAIRVVGQIEAAETLDMAEAVPQAPAPTRPLAGFRPGQESKLAIAEEIELVPGEQIIRFRAKTPHSVVAEQQITVDYQPPVPTAVVMEPKDQTTLVEGPQRITLRARLTPSHGIPYVAEVVVNGETTAEPAVIDEETQSLTAEVELQPGENQLQVRTRNQWGAMQTTSPVLVRYLRPPSITEIEAPDVGISPLADVVFWVQSPPELPLTGATVNDRPIPEEGITRQDDRWKVTARRVALFAGENILRVRASNGEGTSAPRMIRVNFQPVTPPRVTLEVGSDVVQVPQVEVALRVRSSTPLARVELLRGSEVLFELTDSTAVRETMAGRFEFEARPVVPLQRGDNHLRLVAINDRGIQAARSIVSYVAPPARIIVDHLQPVDQPQQRLHAERQPDGSVVFSTPAPAAELSVHGRVVWPDDQDPNWLASHAVRVSVNGFLQPFPTELQPPAEQELVRNFQSRILLNHSEKNLVELEIAGLATEANSRLQFHVDCQQPQTGQRLHLLIVGIDEDEPADLERRALRALQIRRNARGEFEKDGFDEVGVYHRLAGIVNAPMVFFQLDGIRRTVQRLASHPSKQLNDVVILYYQGGEVIDPDQRIALSTSFRNEFIDSDILVRFVDATPGAHLLLFDVARMPSPSDGDAPATGHELTLANPEDRVGILRTVWLRGSTPPPPPDIRLLTALERAVPHAARLADVESRISLAFAQLSQQYPQALLYDPHLPLSLQDLMLGAEPR